MKPRIFIGSSTEGLVVAKRVKAFFQGEYDTYIWTDDIFQFNEGFLETLIKSASLFNFGFMIFSSDDISKIRDKEYNTARDNVLFEYGLFLGRVGIDRAYIIKEDDVKIPSDISGITLLSYTSKITNGIKEPNDDFEEQLARLKKKIDEKVRLGYLGLLPSTVIAISYFENFIKLLADEIMRQGDKIQIGNNVYKSAKIRIVIPKTLDADMKRQATIYFRKIRFESCPITTVHRSYPIYVESTSEDNIKDEVIIADMPTILSGIDKAIDMYFRVGHIGKTQEQQLTEERELNNFTHVLSLLISQEAFCREIVEIVDDDNQPLES